MISPVDCSFGGSGAIQPENRIYIVPCLYKDYNYKKSDLSRYGQERLKGGFRSKFVGEDLVKLAIEASISLTKKLNRYDISYKYLGFHIRHPDAYTLTTTNNPLLLKFRHMIESAPSKRLIYVNFWTDEEREIAKEIIKELGNLDFSKYLSERDKRALVNQVKKEFQEDLRSSAPKSVKKFNKSEVDVSDESFD